MNILVIAGSPKGETSVTRQYVNYLRNQFVEHDWSLVDVAFGIRRLETSPEAFTKVLAEVRRADIVLWAFPVYFMLVPAGYKRFIELIHESGAAGAFAGKYAASLSTSIHFCDNYAHDYIRAVSEDLGLRYLGAHSPEMHDLLSEQGRRQLAAFGRHILQCALTQAAPPRRYQPLPVSYFDYRPGPAVAKIDLQGRKLVILHDATEDQGNLRRMVERFAAALSGEVAAYNLREMDIAGDCLGCLRCGAANRCAYEGKDGYTAFFENVLKRADILVFAGSVVDRHWSAVWRRFFERSFYNTHIPTFSGRQMAFLVSGPLSQLDNLREMLSTHAQMQEANLVDLVADQDEDSGLLDRQLDSLAMRLVDAALDGYRRPLDFRGVGGRKIFRDHIFGRLRPVFTADHRHYARAGFYDFPTRDFGQRTWNAVLGLLFRFRGPRRAFEKNLKTGMIKPLIRFSGQGQERTSM
jgi:multimeric flavodoxin WrbA